MKIASITLIFLLAATAHITLAAPDEVGPYVGTLTNTEAHLLYRPGNSEQSLRLSAIDSSGKIIATSDSKALAENDFSTKFHLTGLKPGTKYQYKIDALEDSKSTPLIQADNTTYFKTTPINRTGQILNAAFISCVNDTSDGIWAEMNKHPLDLLCLSGDTPYIDSSKMPLIRSKHRHLLQRKDLAKLGRHTSVIGTWDDHDFGRNNGNGVTMLEKQNTTKGFIEYRAHDQYGNGSEGIYHKADMGSMELFMLDPRWFSMTGPSSVNPTQPTGFGSDQWKWLLKSLKNSKAPFKVIVQGQIWQDKKNNETDDMYTYWAERDALLDFIKKEKITGVVLVGGDIHVSRYLLHSQRVGYDLHDFVISPGHSSVIKSLNVYHPSLEWSRPKANQYLKMKADTTKDIPELTVTFTDNTGATNHQTTLTLHDLTPKENKSITTGLRAYWPMDNDLKNKSTLGTRLDATSKNNATITNTGIQGGAASFDRTKQQHLTIPRSFLDDNSSTYSYSVWIKPKSLPANNSKDRSFILESNINNHCKLPQASTTGYALSLGLKSAETADKINLQLYTETLKPAHWKTRAAPGVIAQGGFDCYLDRATFANWTHIAVTFDTKSLKLYINGELTKTHHLPTPAPIAETGGLIIGGHRAGTGRNFHGLIDELAIWNRTLTASDISLLYNQGNPTSLLPPQK